MKKLICFSLWGNHEFYNYGALENALIAKEIYPGWICRYYYLNNCDSRIINELRKLDNVELVEMSGVNSSGNTLWRFEPAFMEDDVIFVSRDTDSRLNIREKLAVDQWLNSDKDFHIMRDHPLHGIEILAGMWGCRNNILRPYRDIYKSFMCRDIHGVDQDFLKDLIYSRVLNRSIIHASHCRYEHNCIDFPVSNYTTFVGAYAITAPRTLRILGEDENRILSVVHPHQAIYV
jgi:protein O-GlcNAc transferase